MTFELSSIRRDSLVGPTSPNTVSEMVDNKLIHGDIALADYTEKKFTKFMTSVSITSNIYDNGK